MHSTRAAACPSPPHSHHRLKVSAATVAELFLAAATVQAARNVFQECLCPVTLDQLLGGDLRHVSATAAAQRQPPQSAEVSESSHFLQRDHHER